MKNSSCFEYSNYYQIKGKVDHEWTDVNSIFDKKVVQAKYRNEWNQNSQIGCNEGGQSDQAPKSNFYEVENDIKNNLNDLKYLWSHRNRDRDQKRGTEVSETFPSFSLILLSYDDKEDTLNWIIDYFDLYNISQ